MLVVTGLSLYWCTLPTVPVVVRGSSLLTIPFERQGFYSRTAGTVASVRVKVGDRVRRNQVLATLDQTLQGSGPGQPLDPRTLVSQQRAIDEQIAAIQTRIRELQTTNQPVKQQMEALDDLRREDVVARYSPLWVGAQDLYLRNRADIVTLRSQISQLQATRAGLQGARQALNVYSPVEGEVLDLSITPGKPVAPGERLGSLSTRSDRDLTRALVFLTAQNASLLRPGQDLEIEPQFLSDDSFGSGTGDRFGGIVARVERISPTTLTAEDLTALVGSADLAASLITQARQEAYGNDLEQLSGKLTTPVVMADVRLDTAATPSGLRWSRGSGPAFRLAEGSLGTASAEVERRSVFSYLRPFLNWLTGFTAPHD